jgi:hypothetical protein
MNPRGIRKNESTLENPDQQKLWQISLDMIPALGSTIDPGNNQVDSHSRKSSAGVHFF